MKVQDAKRYAEAKRRYAEVMRHSEQEVNGNRFLRVTGDYVADVDYLVTELERVAGDRKVSDPAKFTGIKNRVYDLVKHHAELIEEKKFMRVAGCLFQEMGWLLTEIERLTASEKAA